MDITLLEQKWLDVSNFKKKKGYSAIRLSSSSVPDLFIGNDENGNRCLLLYLPKNVEVDINKIEKEKLSMMFIEEKNIIMIKLVDVDFIDLFNDLVISLYSKIKDISNPRDYYQKLIRSFFKWSEFFESNFPHKLSLEEIKGLFGELFYLRELLQDASITNVNSILDSWKGPYDTSNDFIFDEKNIEVKTKEEKTPLVKISSEFQLEKEPDKGLELLVVSIRPDLINGKSLSDLLGEIIFKVRVLQGDLSILLRALAQKGLTVNTTKEYNNHRFTVSKTSLYDCTQEDFPRLSASTIPEGISKIKYLLRISTIENHLVKENIIDNDYRRTF